MSRPALLVPALAATVALAAALPTPAHAVTPIARPAASPYDLLDADATLVLALKPRAVWTLVAWLESFGGATKPLIAGGLAEAASSLQRELGVDPLHEATWIAAGLDPNRPIVAGLAAIDHVAARRAFDALAKNLKAKTATPYWRSRFVLGVVDAGAFKKTLTAATQGPAWALVEGAPETLAKVLGLDAKNAAAAKAKLTAQRVLAVWRPGEDTLGFLRAGDGIVIGDVFSPFARRELDGKELPALLKLVGRTPVRRGITPSLGSPAGAALLAADAGAWTTSDRVIDLGQALGRQQILGAISYDGGIDPAQLKAIVAQGSSEVARCDDLRPLPRTLGMLDAAWTLDVKPKNMTTRLTTSLAPASPLPAALTSTDDGLVDLATGAEAPAVGVYYGAGLKGLLGLPRPWASPAKGKPPLDLPRAVAECGAAGLMTMAAFAWPYGIGQLFDEAPTEVKPLIMGARNVAVAWKTFSTKRDANLGVIVGSFEPALATPLQTILGALGGTRGTRKAGARNVDTFSRANEPVIFVAQPTTTVAAGTAFGGVKAIDWFWGKPSPKGAPGKPPALAALRADVAAILKQLGPGLDAGARPVLDDVAKRLGTLAGTIKVAPEALTFEMGLELK